MIQLRPATAADIPPIAANMREMDRLECSALGYSPERALAISLLGDRETYTLTRDGEPVGMVGVATVDALQGVGRPWLLATPELMAERRSWAILGPQIMALLQKGHRVLENHVHQRNAASIAWLRRLGCKVGSGTVIIGGEPFREFRRCA